MGCVNQVSAYKYLLFSFRSTRIHVQCSFREHFNEAQYAQVFWIQEKKRKRRCAEPLFEGLEQLPIVRVQLYLRIYLKFVNEFSKLFYQVDRVQYLVHEVGTRCLYYLGTTITFHSPQMYKIIAASIQSNSSNSSFSTKNITVFGILIFSKFTSLKRYTVQRLDIQLGA